MPSGLEKKIHQVIYSSIFPSEVKSEQSSHIHHWSRKWEAQQPATLHTGTALLNKSGRDYHLLDEHVVPVAWGEPVEKGWKWRMIQDVRNEEEKPKEQYESDDSKIHTTEENNRNKSFPHWNQIIPNPLNMFDKLPPRTPTHKNIKDSDKTFAPNLKTKEPTY